MKSPIWDYGDSADQYTGDIWRIEPHLFEGCKVLDIGANRGLVTALCAINGAYVTAYEPNPYAYKYLLQTITSNQINERVLTQPIAVWTHIGTVKMDMKKECIRYANSLVVDRANRDYFNAEYSDWDIDVPCVSFISAIGQEEWDIVKMDIEGAEFPILLECPDSVLQQIKYLTVELHMYKGNEHKDVMAKLNRLFNVETQEGVYCTRK